MNRLTDPVELCPSGVLVAAPHMDDEVLGCGGLLARLPDPGAIHILYAADGRGSARFRRGRPSGGPDLGAVRIAESRAAMSLLGVPERNLTFSGFPDGTLSAGEKELAGVVDERLRQSGARTLLAPFRFDRHPDHEALHRACRACASAREGRVQLVEYFVYHRWRMLPGGDIRRILRADLLSEVATGGVSDMKRRMLECFRTQVEPRAGRPGRPVLSRGLVDESVAGPEIFLRAPASMPDRDLFRTLFAWFRFVHRVEPWMKSNFFGAAPRTR